VNLYESIRKENKDKRADCAVIALSLLTKLSYSDTEALLAKHGRKLNRGTPIDVIYKVLADLSPCDYQFDSYLYDIEKSSKYRNEMLRDFWSEYGNMSGVIGMTISRLARVRKLQKGKYLVLTRSHALAMIDGEVLDWTKGRRHRVVAIYKIGDNV
jgi:hypothetical protein